MVISSGKYFGEEMILSNAQRTETCRSLTYLHLYVFEQDSLRAILETGEFKATAKCIRRQSIRLALKRKLLQMLTVLRFRPDYKRMTKEDKASFKELQLRQKFQLESWEKIIPMFFSFH